MSTRSKKILVAVLVAAVLFVSGIAALLLTEFESPELGRLALNQVGKSVDLDLKAVSFRLNLLRGLELGQVEAKGQLPDGELQASVERLVLKHRPRDLLSGTLTVTEVVIERPQVTVVSSDAGSPTGATEVSQQVPPAEISERDDGATTVEGGRTLALAISTIGLKDGSVVQRSTKGGVTETMEIRGLDLELNNLTFGGEPEPGQTADGDIRIDEVVMGSLESGDDVGLTTVRGIDIDLRELRLDPADVSNLAGATLLGELTFAEVVSGETQAQDASSQIELVDGQLKLPDLKLTAPQGELHGHLEAAVSAEPMTYSLRLDGDALNTGVLLGLGDIPGLGTSQFELSATGNAEDDTQLLGNGRLTLGGGTLPDHPIFAQLETILGNAALIGAGYDSFPLEFDIRSQRLHLAECELRTGLISFTMSGWLDFEGPLEMQLSVLTPREGLSIKEIPVEVLEVLAEEDGRVNLPMLISGTADLSQVALNQEALKKLGKRYAQKTVEKELTKALSGLFGKKKENN